MKQKRTKWIDTIEEISIEDTVKDFFDVDWNPRDWKETESYIDSYIEDFIEEISEEEEDKLRHEIRKEFDRRVFELVTQEKEQFKDRNSILMWIEDTIEFIDVGYILTPEEILDLILKNSNK